MNKKALHKISYGLYVVSSMKDGRYNGQIANTVFQITSDPVMIAVSLNKQNLTHEYVAHSRKFSVSVLAQDTPLKFIGRFGFKSGRDINKFEGVNYREGVTGVPIVIDHAVAYLEAEVVSSIDVETHTIFIGKVVDSDVLLEEPPMTYDYYHKVKRGTAPKTAPTYIGEVKQEKKTYKKYRCKVCGYVYDPELGDASQNIKAGTPFEELPDDWTCPVCGASKDDFVEID